MLSGNNIVQKVLPYNTRKKDLYLLIEMVLKMGKLVCIQSAIFISCCSWIDDLGLIQQYLELKLGLLDFGGKGVHAAQKQMFFLTMLTNGTR